MGCVHTLFHTGELKEREGDDMAAINLYMKAGMPARAARLATSRDELMNNNDLIQRIANALIKVISNNFSSNRQIDISFCSQ